ncbi:hypothetical protein KCP74_14410 [Salmonella enterica subsp. enterica]|nr:hypothetical protein KCP74_14410 [Salmonella enterica subsp. enterica]
MSHWILYVASLSRYPIAAPTLAPLDLPRRLISIPHGTARSFQTRSRAILDVCGAG